MTTSIPTERIYSLTTAEILYHLPDHPHVLQTFVWQKLDLAPDYPELKAFLKFWHERLDGPLHSVRVAGREILRVVEVSTPRRDGFTLLH